MTSSSQPKKPREFWLGLYKNHHRTLFDKRPTDGNEHYQAKEMILLREVLPSDDKLFSLEDVMWLFNSADNFRIASCKYADGEMSSGVFTMHVDKISEALSNFNHLIAERTGGKSD